MASECSLLSVICYPGSYRGRISINEGMVTSIVTEHFQYIQMITKIYLEYLETILRRARHALIALATLPTLLLSMDAQQEQQSVVLDVAHSIFVADLCFIHYL